ncbi:MAG TPA: DUF3800 domain-containing protein [Terriglobales bacterium]|jgi:hypothetical protein|nr:DUF3800 domain-containing protein [Terriglobales bacterium]
MFKALAEVVRLSGAGERVYLTVAGSYMDESFDPKRAGQARGFFVVAGLMGRGWAIFELERNWEKLLEKHGLQYFKASECELGKKQFERFSKDSKNISPAERKLLDEISLEFINTIPHPIKFDTQRYLAASGVAILQEDFYEVIKDAHARAVLGENPYRLAYDIAFVASAWLMKQLGEGWGVSIVADEHEIYSPLAPEAYRNLKEKNPKAAEYLLSFTSIDEKKCAPVQAADAVVYEVRRALNTKHKIPGLVDAAYREQFKVLCNGGAVAHIAETRKLQLEWIAANHKPGEPFKLDELMNNEIGDNVDLFGIRQS